MIAVIFEVTPTGEGKEAYLAIAAELRQHLQQIKGFISIERFQSLTNPDKLLSLSFWENEEALAEWRNLEEHRLAQTRGRNQLFADYRIRVGSILRDYSLDDRQQAPADSRHVHDKN
jgi:heme-degrading monooxygenase HmoA